MNPIIVPDNSPKKKKVKASKNSYTAEYINDLLIRNSDTHDRSTRFCNLNLSCPRYKRNTEGGKTFSVRTIKEWNSVSAERKRSPSVKCFKRSLFKQVLNYQIHAQLFM